MHSNIECKGYVIPFLQLKYEQIQPTERLPTEYLLGWGCVVG